MFEEFRMVISFDHWYECNRVQPSATMRCRPLLRCKCLLIVLILLQFVAICCNLLQFVVCYFLLFQGSLRSQPDQKSSEHFAFVDCGYCGHSALLDVRLFSPKCAGYGNAWSTFLGDGASSEAQRGTCHIQSSFEFSGDSGVLISKDLNINRYK